MARNVSGHAGSPERGRRSPRRSPSRRSASRREKSPARHRSSHRSRSPADDKRMSRPRSPPRRNSPPPASRSPSPRTKRLRRSQSDRESEKLTRREHDRSRGERNDKGGHRERSSDRDVGGDRREKRSERDDTNGKSSRSRHARSTSPPEHHNRSRHRSLSPRPAADARAHDEVSNARRSEQQDDEIDAVAKMEAAEKALEEKQKEKPSFELSGKLAAETNKVRGVTLLFNEPPEARKPDMRWRLYVFKGGEVLNEPLYIHRQSCYLFGRERRVADIPTDHPSCSKQHAVIQFRQVEKEQPDGTLSKKTRPYLMDLGSTNKTLLNENPIEPQRYYELFEKDTIKFGNSSREYVLLHENSAG